jgi:sugar phosphate isomerase/epimerase
VRLGGFYSAERADDLDALCELIDRHGLSAIPAPNRLAEMPDEECLGFGERADDLGLVIGEAGMWDSLMTPDPAVRAERIERVRTLLGKADLMGCRCVVCLVGSPDPSDAPLAPHPLLLAKEGADAFREIVLRILDGLELTRTRFAIEPWRTSFFFEPEAIAEFLASVDHPRLALHLDLVNMVDRRDYFDTAALAERTFSLLGDRIIAAHLKDLRWDPEYMALRWDEVLVGDGVMDYPVYLRGLDALDPDLPCFCEHLQTEAAYAENFARLHRVAASADLRFLSRRSMEGAPR